MTVEAGFNVFLVILKDPVREISDELDLKLILALRVGAFECLELIQAFVLR